ncbi:hypothetical protein PIB30_043908 [Stylosanthes scabra]|uniref:Uncharacterized protein n=1 Tax=Stylosanthes scabra TaxID=79078 RepID=A0ABU6UH04_9FABA|nr:hypothetical protein [Stylosanthes scabra]
MQPQKSSRIDLAEFKAHIVKKVGADKSKKNFYYLNRFLSQKLGKNNFDKLCFRVLRRENISLHNRFISSILKNACQAKFPSPVQPSSTPKLVAQSGTNFQSQNQNASIWSNEVLPVSPRKVRFGILDRKHKDRPSPL